MLGLEKYDFEFVGNVLVELWKRELSIQVLVE
jgi:hypothetical protein